MSEVRNREAADQSGNGVQFGKYDVGGRKAREIVSSQIAELCVHPGEKPFHSNHTTAEDDLLWCKRRNDIDARLRQIAGDDFVTRMGSTEF